MKSNVLRVPTLVAIERGGQRCQEAEETDSSISPSSSQDSEVVSGHTLSRNVVDIAFDDDMMVFLAGGIVEALGCRVRDLCRFGLHLVYRVDVW